MLEYHRYRQAAEHLRERLEAEHGYRYRSAPLPPELRRISLEAAEAAYDPVRLAEALGGLLTVPPPLDLRHVRRSGRLGRAAPAPPARPARRAAAASRSTRPWRAPTGSPRP